MATQAQYLEELDKLVPGSLSLGDAEKLKAIKKALETHSKYRPRRIVEDVSGADAFDYALASLSCWDADFSRILSIEYPVDEAGTAVNEIDNEDWTIYEKPTGLFLRFLGLMPETGKSIRLTYTARHKMAEEDPEPACTVPAADTEAVQALSAAYFCRMLAASYAQDQDSTIAADSVDHSSKRREYEAQAAKYRAEYDEHVGVSKDGGPKPACLIQDQDVSYPNGWDRLTHPRRWR